MTPQIKTIPPKMLVGMHTTVSQKKDDTIPMWQGFMPKRREIEKRLNDKEYYSIQVFKGLMDFNTFGPDTTFENWAAVEVSEFYRLPNGMDKFTIEGGTYAVFLHKGPANAFMKTLGYILNTWLPTSDYELDERVHFQVIQEGYNPMDANAEEELWIPVKSRV